MARAESLAVGRASTRWGGFMMAACVMASHDRRA